MIGRIVASSHSLSLSPLSPKLLQATATSSCPPVYASERTHALDVHFYSQWKIWTTYYGRRKIINLKEVFKRAFIDVSFLEFLRWLWHKQPTIIRICCNSESCQARPSSGSANNENVVCLHPERHAIVCLTQLKWLRTSPEACRCKIIWRNFFVSLFVLKLCSCVKWFQRYHVNDRTVNEQLKARGAVLFFFGVIFLWINTKGQSTRHSIMVWHPR